MGVPDVRPRFPGLSDGWIRFDGPAGSLPVDTSIDAIHDYLRSPAPANVGGAFAASLSTTELVEQTRATCGRLLGADAEQVIFGPNATSLIFQLTRALARTWEKGDQIVVTQLDHDANVRPWRLAAADVGVEVVQLPVDAEGRLDLAPLAGLTATGRVRWVALSGASNLTGVVPDLAQAVAIARADGAKVFVDAVARVPHLPTDVGALGVDGLVTSPYKWYGPHAGVLVLDPALIAGVEPYRVKPADYTGPSRWETGTKAFEALAGVAAAADFLLEQPWEGWVAYERGLLDQLESGLRGLAHVTVHTPPEPAPERAPTTIFTVAGHSPEAVAGRLAHHRIAVWAGDNYACDLVDALGLRAGGGAVRAGIVRYTSADDVDALVTADSPTWPDDRTNGPPARMPAARADHEP